MYLVNIKIPLFIFFQATVLEYQWKVHMVIVEWELKSSIMFPILTSNFRVIFMEMLNKLHQIQLKILIAGTQEPLSTIQGLAKILKSIYLTRSQSLPVSYYPPKTHPLGSLLPLLIKLQSKHWKLCQFYLPLLK